MNAEFAHRGAHIDAFYYSPYHPEAAVERYRRVSPCRKPGRDLYDRAVADLRHRRAGVGRRGRQGVGPAAGARTRHADGSGRDRLRIEETDRDAADLVVPTLADAVAALLS